MTGIGANAELRRRCFLKFYFCGVALPKQKQPRERCGGGKEDKVGKAGRGERAGGQAGRQAGERGTIDVDDQLLRISSKRAMPTVKKVIMCA